MNMWLELHDLRALDLIREAELAHRRSTEGRRQLTSYLPRRRSTERRNAG